MNPEMEGTMLFFRQNLYMEFPFYNCDEDRISISGNIGLNIKNIMKAPLLNILPINIKLKTGSLRRIT